MIDSRKVLEGLPLYALATACVTVGILAVTIFRPEAVFDRSVESALSQSSGKALAQAQPPSRLADSPYFHLSSHDELPLGLSKSVTVGDQITISGTSGIAQALEVVDIREVDAGLTPASTASTPRFLLVTCRDLKSTQRLVRFIIEAEGPEKPTGRPHRTL